MHDVAAAATVGLLVLAATVFPPGPGELPHQLAGARARAVRAAGASGSVWVLAGTMVLVLTVTPTRCAAKVYSARQRYIVHAVLESIEDRAGGPPAALTG